MCYVIVTLRLLLWALLSVACTLCMLIAVMTPKWLLGPERSPGLRSISTTSQSVNAEEYSPTLGIYNRCTNVHRGGGQFQFDCASFARDFDLPADQFPHWWKASLVSLCIGLVIMALTLLISVLSCCVQNCGRKSIFNIAGAIQSIAGLFFVLGLVLYPAGWGSRRVHLVCGDSAGPFDFGDCSIGWACYLAVGGTLLTFLTAYLSVQADSSTSSDKVQDEILEGKSLICLA